MFCVQGLLYLTCLTKLQLSMQEAPSDRMLSELAELTALRCLRPFIAFQLVTFHSALGAQVGRI